MKRINFSHTITTEKGYKPKEVKDLFIIQNIIDQNIASIILEAGRIEQTLENYICTYFTKFETLERDIFTTEILQSSSMSFSLKRTVFLTIAKKTKALTNKKHAALQQDLANVIKYRNAIVHGKVKHGSDGTYLKYYQGSSKEKLLDDDYWNKVETTFKRVADNASKLYATINDSEQA